MPILVEIPDRIIRQVQRCQYLLKNEERTTNGEFRLGATERLQENIQEIVYAIIVKKMEKDYLLRK